MTLATQLVDELRARAGQSSQSIVIQCPPRTLCCEAALCEQLSATIDELSLESPELAAASVSQLQDASQDLCRRVNYLLEPIAPIETDATGCSVQMRSNPPQKDDNGWKYYELLLKRGGSVALARYEKPPGQPRKRVPAVLTHEVLGRLADDFAITIDSI